MTKEIIIGTSAFAAGIAAGFFIAKKALADFYDSQYQEDRASLNAHVRMKVKEGLKKELEKRGITDDDAVNHSGHVTRSSIDKAYRPHNSYEGAKQNYQAHFGTQSMDDGEDELTDAAGMTEDDMRVRDLSDIDRSEPYVISDIEYIEEFEDHNKVSLFYYREDDVLCEESSEIIENIEDTVGYEALGKTDMQTTVYVRNEPLGIDYEIMVFNESFQDAMRSTPVNLSPREAYEKRKGR